MASHSEFLQVLLNTDISGESLISDAQQWRRAFLDCESGDLPIDAALQTGQRVDRLAYAFASGYQSALRQMFAQLPGGAISSLCVTEASGNRPRHIETALVRQGAGYLLSGHKKFITCAKEADRLLIAAADGVDPQGRNQIRLVVVDKQAKGVNVEEMPPLGFVPEISHGEVSLESVAVDEVQILPGDGYLNFVKPFRTVEDIHVNGAILAYLLGAGRRNGWPAALIEKILLLIVEARELSQWSPENQLGHLVLAAHLQQVAELVVAVSEQWRQSDSQEAQRWQQDRKLLGVAAGMRDQRLIKAREALSK